MPKPPPGGVSNPSGDAETQHPFTGAVQAGSVRHRSMESAGGNKQVAQAEFWWIDLSGWEQLKHIQGLSWKHSCSRHGTGHAWEGAASRDPLWLPQCLLPLEAHRVLTQPQQTALLQGTACSKHELAQVLLPRHRGRDSSHRFGTPDSHAAQERLVS